MKIDFLFHPPLVHFPIAFYFFELLLLFFWTARKNPDYLRFARFSFLTGYVFMIPTLIAGWTDAGGFVPLVRTHALFAASVALVYTLRLFYWWKGRPEQINYQKIQLAGAIIGYLLVIITGFEGGELVYGK